MCTRVSARPSARSLPLHTPGSKWDAGNQASNLCTVTVLPASKEVPLTAFTLELQLALLAIGEPPLRGQPQGSGDRMGSQRLYREKHPPPCFCRGRAVPILIWVKS